MFCDTLKNWEGDWFAVCDHVGYDEGIALLVDNGDLDYFLNYEEDEADHYNIAAGVLTSWRHSWVRPADPDVEEAPSENWYYECEEDHPEAIAVTVYEV